MAITGLLLAGVALHRQSRRLDALEAAVRQQHASLVESGIAAADLADAVAQVSRLPRDEPEAAPPASTGVRPLEVRITALEERLNRPESGRHPSGSPEVSEYDPDQPPPAEEPPKPAPEASRAWSAEQALGPPDTPTAADAGTAWAPQDPDGGAEWLQVGFATATEVAEVRVRESFNAGAIRRITALAGGAEVTLWEGSAGTSRHLRDFVVRSGPGVLADTITIHLDTREVPGWNEIDAVALVGRDGSRQWASSARASSSYASRGMVQLGGESFRTEF